MATDFGKLLRIWRIEHGINMAQMAESLDLSTAYLSAVELGKKPVKDNLLSRIKEHYSVDDEVFTDMQEAAHKSNGNLTFNLNEYSDADQNNVLVFARKYKNLSSEKKNQLRRLLDSVQ